MSNYINEVSIDGKKTSRFNFRVGYYDLYIAQVMRAGNCLTLLSSPINFSIENFSNTNLLEDMVKYVFWTFNENFLMQAIHYLPKLTQSELQTLQQFLEKNLSAFTSIDEKIADEELIWCLVKNGRLKADPKFATMYQKDEENRKAFLEAITGRINIAAPTIEMQNIHAVSEKTFSGLPVTFLDMLHPLNGDAENTLAYIQYKIREAQFPHNIFIQLAKDRKGRNPIGVNSEIAAMIDCFRKKGYFKPDFTFKDIFKAFGIYSKNSAGKEYDFTFFEDDYRYERYTEMLRSIEIEQLEPFEK